MKAYSRGGIGGLSEDRQRGDVVGAGRWLSARLVSRGGSSSNDAKGYGGYGDCFVDGRRHGPYRNLRSQRLYSVREWNVAEWPLQYFSFNRYGRRQHQVHGRPGKTRERDGPLHIDPLLYRG